MSHRKKKDWYWKDCVQENEKRSSENIYLVHTDLWMRGLYCEQKHGRRLEAMEMWCWRRLMRVSWTERGSNANILEIIGERRELLRNLRKGQMVFLGHAIRADGFENLAITGRIIGSRSRGRPRMKYLNQMKEYI